MIPLFDDEQLRRLEELQQGAPLLLRRELEMQRPGWMRLEQEREDLQRDAIKKRQSGRESRRLRQRTKSLRGRTKKP